ncbi:MAG: hypothetical protein ABIH04_05640, partial [Planctomycetota bacterium]
MPAIKNIEEIMAGAHFPDVEPAPDKTAYLVANGDLRDSANKVCWPEQEKMEKALTAAFTQRGYNVIRAHKFDPELGHGFINS